MCKGLNEMLRKASTQGREQEMHVQRPWGRTRKRFPWVELRGHGCGQVGGGKSQDTRVTRQCRKTALS